MSERAVQKSGPEIWDYYYVDSRRDWVIICPGGAYSWLSPRESDPVARAFNRAGYNAVVLRYSTLQRLGEGQALGDRPVQELEELVTELRAEHPRARVYLNGYSAGGYLCLSYLRACAQQGREPGISRYILAYPVSNGGAKSGHARTGAARYGKAQPDEETWPDQLYASFPPGFIWHTAEDASVPAAGSLELAAQLLRAGASVELHIFPHGRHGLSLATAEVEEVDKARLRDPHVARWFDLALDFLRLDDLPPQAAPGRSGPGLKKALT